MREPLLFDDITLKVQITGKFVMIKESGVLTYSSLMMVVPICDSILESLKFFLGYACVVDMGDQKTSISCVEDGISHSETRIHLDYGGADITQVQSSNNCNSLFSKSLLTEN